MPSPVPYVLLILAAAVSHAQVAKPPAGLASTAQRGISLARDGRCREAMPLLRKARLAATDKDLKREAGFSGVRCAMILNQADPAIDFLRFLNREFPGDPEVLYVSVHTYSDLSTRAAQQLASSAPSSAQARQLNAESLEVQGKWDEAAAEYRLILKQEPRSPGIHFRLGRLLLSKPNPGPSMAEEARKEFVQELEIDPSNAGAEFVLGELARQAQQWDEAIAHFTRATKLDAQFPDAFLALGSSLLSVKRFTEAIPPLETAVKLESRNPAAHYNLATAYSRTGRKADADREFAIHKQMTEKRPGEPGSGQAASPEDPQ
jgi:tetratricopeptide (TPR) repeat protein